MLANPKTLPAIARSTKWFLPVAALAVTACMISGKGLGEGSEPSEEENAESELNPGASVGVNRGDAGGTSGGGSEAGRGGGGGSEPTAGVMGTAGTFAAERGSIGTAGSSGTGAGGLAGGGAVGQAGGEAGEEPPPATPVHYTFEINEEGWRDVRNHGTVVKRTLDRSDRSAGQSVASLRVGIDTRTVAGTNRFVGVPGGPGAPTIRVGQILSLRVLVPMNNKVTSLQAFFVSREGANPWVGTPVPIENIKLGAWNTLTVQVPPGFAVDDLDAFGLEIATKPEGWVGNVFIDNVVLSN